MFHIKIDNVGYPFKLFRLMDLTVASLKDGGKISINDICDKLTSNSYHIDCQPGQKDHVGWTIEDHELYGWNYRGLGEYKLDRNIDRSISVCLPDPIRLVYMEE